VKTEDRYLGVIAFAVWILSIICVVIVNFSLVEVYVELTGPALAIILSFYFARQAEARARLGKSLEFEIEDVLILILCIGVIIIVALLFLYYVVPYLPKFAGITGLRVVG